MASRSRVKTTAHAIGGSSTRLVRQTARVATAAGLSPLPPRAWPCPLLNALPLPLPAVTMKPVPKSMGLATGVVCDTCNGFFHIATQTDVWNAEFIPHCPPGSCDGNWSVSTPAPRLAFPLMILASAFARSNDECDHTCATIMNHDDPDRSSYGYGEYTMTNHLTDGPPVKFYT